LKEYNKNIDLNLLSNTINNINKSTDFQTTAEIIFGFIMSFIDFNMAVIYKIDDKENLLEIVSCLGSDAEKLKRRMPFKVGDGAVGLVAKNKKPILINDVLKNKEIQVRQYCDEDPVIRSFLAVPLVVGDKAIGILSISNSQPEQYDDYDVQMINIIASQGAVLLELNNNITETQRFSNNILDNVNSGIIVVDINCNVVKLNKSAENITGFKFEEIVGSDILAEHLFIDNEENFICKCFNEGKIYFEEPGFMVRRDKNIIRVRLSTSLMYDEEGNIKSCICIFRDNTEIENLQSRIAMTDKLEALGRLTAGLVHEIRNPLLPIRNASEYLLNKYGETENNDEMRSLLKIISEESERLNRVLEGFVNMGKNSFASMGNCDLKEVIDEVITLLNYTINKNNIKTEVNFTCGSIVLPYNKDNLKQVFINLMLNSVDAINMNDDSKPRIITISVNQNNNHASVSIEDTGTGIQKKDLHQIFDPFYSTKEHGTGMGLYIAFNIIKSSGGVVDVHSSNDKGTKIILTIPMEEGPLYEY
jgi:PAS domain S-box-containing protein